MSEAAKKRGVFIIYSNVSGIIIKFYVSLNLWRNILFTDGKFVVLNN